MERILQIVEVQAAFFSGYDVTVRWRWEDGTTGKDVYLELSQDELLDLLAELCVFASELT